MSKHECQAYSPELDWDEAQAQFDAMMIASPERVDQLEAAYEQGRADAFAQVSIDLTYALKQLRPFGCVARACDALRRIEAVIGLADRDPVQTLAEVLAEMPSESDLPF